jgi:ribosome biogenesis GTPase A
MALANILKKERNIKNNAGGIQKIVLIGNPNVGKSVIFGNLTGKYVTVSNCNASMKTGIF